MNSGLTSHQQRGHTETGPRFKVSSERPEKRGIEHAIPGCEPVIVLRVGPICMNVDICLNTQRIQLHLPLTSVR